MLAGPRTTEVISRATFRPGPHKQVCKAQGELLGSTCSPCPSESRTGTSRGHQRLILHAQVLVTTRPPGSCTRRYCVTAPVCVQKSHESLSVSSAASTRFSAIKTHFRPHKHAFQKEPGNPSSTTTSNCHVLSSRFYSLCSLCVQRTGIVLCRCQQASETFSAYVSSLAPVFCVFALYPIK